MERAKFCMYNWSNRLLNQLLMINRFLKRHFLKTVNEYGEKLASEETTDPKEAEKCHLAKLVLISESENEKRIISLKTLADAKSKALIPHILREIVLLTKKQPNKRVSQMILDLYSILCRDKSGLHPN